MYEAEPEDWENEQQYNAYQVAKDAYESFFYGNLHDLENELENLKNEV